MAELNLGSVSGKTTIPRKRVPLLRIILACGIALFLIVLIPVVRFFSWAKCFDLHGFHTPSGSMCPAICEGEFFLAGMDAYKSRAPQRGEIILFERDQGNASFTKRVIGIGGDTVGGGPANTILINGQPLTLPTPCGEHNSHAPLSASGPPFETTKVPEGSLFVIGDNLDNSYDSRQFGVVPLNKVRGKALLIYFSSNSSRIGCKIR
jgi:signal peptidase I